MRMNAAVWAIYSLCGVPVRKRAASEISRLVASVRTINLNRPPDAGQARPDASRSCLDDCAPSPFGRPETTVRTLHIETLEN
jgi:hypothetical protein